MDKADILKKQVRLWSMKTGKAEAIRKLVIEGLSPSTASMLVNGKYFSTPGPLVEKAIKQALGLKEP